MAVTTEPTLTGATVPSTGRRTAHIPVWLGWGLAALAVLAAAVLVTMALRSDEPDTAVPSHSGVIENGSPVAIDHAAEVARFTRPGAAGVPAVAAGAHSVIVEYGSPVAIDHAADVARFTRPRAAGVPAVAGGAHSVIVEYGSPVAIDHAAEEARNG